MKSGNVLLNVELSGNLEKSASKPYHAVRDARWKSNIANNKLSLFSRTTAISRSTIFWLTDLRFSLHPHTQLNSPLFPTAATASAQLAASPPPPNPFFLNGAFRHRLDSAFGLALLPPFINIMHSHNFKNLTLSCWFFLQYLVDEVGLSSSWNTVNQ